MRTALVSAVLLLFMTAGLMGVDPDKHAAKQWMPPEHAKVVGYYFKLPTDGLNDGQPVPSGFSLLTKTGLDTKQLDALKIKSAELTPEQVRQLTKAMSARKVTGPAACYDPHHIFVFYDAEDHPTGAVEICFGCTGVSTIPDSDKSWWYRHDFVALARLTDALGLWPEGRTVARYAAILKEREKD